LNRKIEDRSPPKRTASRDLTLLTSIEKKFSNQNTQLSSAIRTSFKKQSRSPFKEYTSGLESKTPDYKRSSQLLKSSGYFGEKSSKEMKKSLIKILDTSPRRQRDSPSKLDSDRPYSSLSQAFSHLRSSRIVLPTNSPDKREGANKLTSESLKTLSSFVSENFKSREKESTDKYTTKKSNIFNGSTEIGHSELFKKPSAMNDKLPLSRIYELQDLFNTVGDREFNTLSSDYVEELIKLSSSIMQRVKASSYYNKE